MRAPRTTAREDGDTPGVDVAWVAGASARLIGLRGRSGGWTYRPGGSPAVEPTALAALGLLAADPDRIRAEKAARAAADWLATVQRADGSLGSTPDPAAPGWTTVYASLLWTAAKFDPARRDRAARWLLGSEGRPIPRDDDKIMGHDTTIIGWPWVAETHSWLEPTALAVLALRREGRTGHPRVVEGLRLIRDRAIESGGWNYGNKAVFRHELRPQPAPTGLALLALAGLERRPAVVDRAITYLEETLPTIRSSASLCWGLLGLRAWGHRPAGAAAWLAEAHQVALRRGETATRLSGLLLAAGEGSLELLGLGEGGGRDDG